MSEADAHDGRIYDWEANLSAPSKVLRGLGDAGRRAERFAFRAALTVAIERDVIPRLVIAKRTSFESITEGTTVERRVMAVEVARFRKLLLGKSLDDCASFIDCLSQSGVSRHSVYLDLFSLVARQLGEMWNSDDLNMLEVSIGVGRMQSLLNRISSAPTHTDVSNHKRLVVIGSAPGDQHALGPSIVAEFFRMAGWDAVGGAALTAGAELTSTVQDRFFHVVGISASTEEKAKRLGADITDLRKGSRNRRIIVLVGGHGFDDHPDIFRSIGADGLAADGAGAVNEAERLVARFGCSAAMHSTR